jgi:hypothetical protein
MQPASGVLWWKRTGWGGAGSAAAGAVAEWAAGAELDGGMLVPSVAVPF